jgi:hypothetical protein
LTDTAASASAILLQHSPARAGPKQQECPSGTVLLWLGRAAVRNSTGLGSFSHLDGKFISFMTWCRCYSCTVTVYYCRMLCTATGDCSLSFIFSHMLDFSYSSTAVQQVQKGCQQSNYSNRTIKTASLPV